MVEQFGLAIILSSAVKTSPLISGTTRGMVGSIRQDEELSMTVVPAAANFGAHSRETEAPAENSAISGCKATASVKFRTKNVFPLNKISFPTDFSLATGIKSSTGK